MARYIDEGDIYELLQPTGIAQIHVSQIDVLPRADVAPRAEVALEVIGEVEKMARDYIDGIMLLDPQNTYCFGGINAFQNVIRFLAALKKKYTDATDTNVGHKTGG